MLTPVTRPIRVLCVLIGLIASDAPLHAHPGDNLPKVTVVESQAYLTTHRAQWESKFKVGEPRLFLSADAWPKFISSLQHPDARQAGYRALLKEAADRILLLPAVRYQPPEAMVTPTHTLLSAKEEGWQRGYGDRLVVLALANRLFNEPAYGKKLRELTLAACDFETWGRQGKEGELRDMDLAAGHIVRGIAVAYDWNRALFAGKDREKLLGVIRERVNRLLRGLYGDVFWYDWYSQNHNHVAAAALGLAGLAFYEDIPEAPEWLAGAEINFKRVGQSLAADGSSYEGLPYWSYGRSYILQFIEGVKGVTDAAAIYESPGLREAIAHRIGSSTPGFDGVVMWSDSRGYDVQGPHHILYKLAEVYHDGRGQFLAEQLPFSPQGGGDSLAWTLLWYDPSIKPVPPRDFDYHAQNWDVATTRSGWGADDFMLSVKAGQNSNHHTHLDAGSIALNVAGGWMLLAPGYGFGGGQPGFFDNDGGTRWEFFSNASESHSIILINGRNQRFDRQAYGRIQHVISSPGTWWAEVDLKDAYHDVTDARRHLLHRRGDYVLVMDDVQAAQPVNVEWLAQMPPETVMEKSQLNLAVPTGAGLRITSLDQLDFYQRPATTRVVDVSPARIATFAVKTTGTDVRLAHLLQPVRDLAAATPLKAQRNDTADASHVRVEGTGWVDDLWLARQQPVHFQQGAAAGVARVFLTRTQSGKANSIMVRSATELSFDGHHLRSSTPFDFSAEKIESGWRISLTTPLVGELGLPSGVKLYDARSTVIKVENETNLELPAGRYMLSAQTIHPDDLFGRFDSAVAAEKKEPAPAPAFGETVSRAPQFSGQQVRWEAESKRTEKFGRGKQEPHEDASGGAALMSIGTETPWHRVAWKVNVPTAGTYRLRLRYNLSQISSRINLLIDAPSGAHTQYAFTLPGPQGWSSEREWLVKTSGWREKEAIDATGQVLLLSLEAGEHTVTLASPTEGLNLDALTLDGTVPAGVKAP